MIRIAVVEDEELYAEQLQNYISKYAEERKKQIKVTWFQDGEDIVSGYKGEYDIILLDIQMRFMDGMTAAEKIRELDSEVVLMFITNMIQYAVRGYEVDAMDYVVKPVEYFAFSQKLDKAIGRIQKKTEVFLKVPVEDGVKKLNICYDLPPEKVGVFSTEINKKMKQLFTKRGKLFLVSAEEPTCFAKITKNIQRNRDKLLKNDMKYCSEKKNHV